MGVDRRLSYSNDAVAGIRGRRPGDIVGLTPEELGYPPGILDPMRSAIDRVLAGGESQTFTITLEMPEGTRSYSSRAGPEFGPDGEVVGVVLISTDVTAERDSATALAASLERYRLLAENASDVVCEVDADLTLKWVSPSVERVLGWHPEDLVGTNAVMLMTTDEIDAANESRDRVFSGETLEAVEYRFRMASGELRWMSVHGQPIRDEDGEVAAAVIGLRDCQVEVTTRRALMTLSTGNAILVRDGHEDELLAEMCQTAVDHGGYLFSWYGRPVDDADRTVAAVASSCEFRDYLDAINVSWRAGPVGRDSAGVVLRTDTTTIEDDIVAEASHKPWLEPARVRGFRSSICLPVAVDGTIDGVFVAYAAEPDAFDGQALTLMEDLADQLGLGLQRLRDAGRLARSLTDRALLTTAIDQAAEAIVVTDPTPAILYANPAVVRVTGYSLGELIGQNPRIFQSGLHDPAFYESMWARLAGGRSWHGVLVNRRKNGEVYEEDATIAPVHDADGALVAYVAAKHDLTSMRRLEADLTREQSDRDAVVELMGEVRPAATIQATAAAFCQALNRMNEIDASAVLLNHPSGDLPPVVVAGEGGVAVAGREPVVAIHLEHFDRLLAATAAGPMRLDVSTPSDSAAVDPELVEAMADAGYTAAGYAPIRWEGELTGILIVATRTPAGAVSIASRLGSLAELGSFAGMLLGAQAKQYGRNEELRAEFRDTIDQQRFHPVFQPVVDLASGRVCGYEALTRFDDGHRPDLRFNEAHTVGLGCELETVCARAALDNAHLLPPDVWLSVNFSPAAVIAGHAASVTADAIRPIVIEITEHAAIESYPAVRRAIRLCGPVRVSVDDAGAGFASLRHILELQPDIVKLDIALVHDIDTDPARQALAAGMCHFAAQTGTTLIAEGVETEGEADTVRRLGIELAQGFLFGRPSEAPG